MKNGKLSLNFQLPEIKNFNRFAKSVKENNKDSIKKIRDKNIIKYQRNAEIINHIKNWSRNISGMNYKKRKNSSSNEENNNKLSTIIKSNKKKGNYNLTISCTFKENKPEQDSNKTNFVFNKNLNKYKNNKSLIYNNYYLKRNMFDSIGDINNLQENNIINNNDKNIYLNNNNHYHLSDHNTPIAVKQKSKFDLSTINIGKINNLFYKFPKDNFINSNYINNGLDKNNIIRKSCDENINNNHKKFIINEDSTQNSIFSSNNNIKELEPDKVQKKIKKKYHISQKTKKFGKNLLNINNLKYKLIVPGFMNSSSTNFNGKIFKNLEEEKKSNNYINNSDPLLKDLRKHENLNNVNNFIMILKQHIIIENELKKLILKISNQNNNNESMNNIKVLFDEYNKFFNQLNDISFEIDIFISKEYNILLQKTIHLIIIFHTLIFIMLSLYDINLFFSVFQIYYFDIFNKISFCLYNIFVKFILISLKNNKYNDLSFINMLDDIFADNPKFKIKSSLSNTEIFSLIHKNYELSINKFITILNNSNNSYINEIMLSIKNILLNINKNDLLYYIDICLNVFLYTLLNKNINKAILNSNSTKNKCALKSVPYLPPILDISNYKYTIVLDLDETLGHFISNEIKTKNFSHYGYFISDDKNNFNKNAESKDKIKVGIFLIRPYAKYFLEELNNLCYEIVIFTAGTKEYSDKVLDILDLNNNLIKYRLYRSHISLRNINNDVKDLSLLGRDLNKIIMIDNFPDNYKLQQDNGLPINSWTGDINDTSLKDLLPIMKYIVEKNVKDVRNVIRKIKAQLNNNNINYGKVNLN